MARIYVALCTDGEERKITKNTIKVIKIKGKRLADPSYLGLRKKLSEYPLTEWLVASINVGFTVANVCTLMENPTAFEAEDVYEFYITAQGQVRDRRDPK